MAEAHSIVAGRSCGSCTLCCKVYPVPVLEKPRNVWCKECKPGSGCGIWQKRPEFCRTFHCQWMFDASLGPEWKPDVAKFVMNIQEGKTLAIAVDPGHRHAWKREPYYSKLKEIALKLFAQGIMIVVGDGIHKILITPDDHIIIGKQEEKVTYTLGCERSGSYTRWFARIEDEPAAA